MTTVPNAKRSAAAFRTVSQWLALGGILGPVLRDLTLLVASMATPGYSQIRQPLSDLGVGSNGQVVDALGIVSGLLLLAFAAGFAGRLRSVLGRPWLIAGTVLVGLVAVVWMTVAIFTEAPATLAVHSLSSAVGALSSILAFLVVGLGLLRHPRWHRWGTYSVIASIATVVLAVLLYLTFAPTSPLAAAHIGGLSERLFMLETQAWFIAFGYRLFKTDHAASIRTP